MPEKSEKKLSISSKKYKGETSVISARIPDKMIEDIDAICQNTGRNRNEIISLCLEFAINNIEIKKED
ncbi:MAG: ribbon-helix-helix protein, CopG family [Erysipelotrichaceae bacterium]|nr:ribbon-helix-helix protein, CopG family [Erysipelotrichaceae bacterium]